MHNESMKTKKHKQKMEMKSYYFVTIDDTGEVEFFESLKEMIAFADKKEAKGISVTCEIEVDCPKYEIKVSKILK